jgi:rhodanese-related sulfurtransferase
MDRMPQRRLFYRLAKLLARLCPPCVTAKRSQEIPRIAPIDLCARMTCGEHIVVLDVRHPLDAMSDARVIPGATRVRPQDLAWGKLAFKTDEAIVTYCAMQNEAASEHAARLLRGRGFRDVQVLAGGFAAWRDEGLPLVQYSIRTEDTPHEQRSACRSRILAAPATPALHATETT